MFKCKHNEDCSKYPACGHTCGKSLEELLWHKCHRIRDLEFRMKQANFQVTQIQRACLAARTELDKEDYIPTCLFGYIDCVNDPAYIRYYHPDTWEKLGMPTECDYAKGWEAGCSCCYYDDEDK